MTCVTFSLRTFECTCASLIFDGLPICPHIDATRHQQKKGPLLGKTDYWHCRPIGFTFTVATFEKTNSERLELDLKIKIDMILYQWYMGIV